MWMKYQYGAKRTMCTFLVFQVFHLSFCLAFFCALLSFLLNKVYIAKSPSGIVEKYIKRRKRVLPAGVRCELRKNEITMQSDRTKHRSTIMDQDQTSFQIMGSGIVKALFQHGVGCERENTKTKSE